MQVVSLLILNLFLFGIGLTIVLSKKNIIFIVIGLELILQAAISNFLAFDSQYPSQIQGQILIIFAVAVSICEIVLFIALFLRIYQQYKTADLDTLNSYYKENEIK
jgi:NADH:ubiquinone oxidoreductase subunit K